MWSQQNYLKEKSEVQHRMAQLLGKPAESLELEDLTIEPNSTSPEQALLSDTVSAYRSAQQTRAKLPGEVLAAQIRKLKERAKEVREGRTIGLSGLSHAANGTLIVSALGHVLFVNPAAIRLLQGNTQRELSKPPSRHIVDALDALSPPLGENWLNIWRRVVLAHEEVAFEATTPDQTPVYVAAQPLTVNTEKPTPYASHWVLTLADLSPIRAAQAQREEALAFLSHDIRSPLVSVLALVKSSSESTPLLEDIARYTQRALSTSEQFLQLSRLQMQARFERYELELGQVLANAIEQVYFIAKNKQISVTLETDEAIDPDAGVWIDGNGELLERAFENLLNNAVKYSDTGARIAVNLNQSGTLAIVDVTDHGYGIPADEVDSIFEPYFRSAEPELAENRGAGLGLRFVKTVVDRHEGNIEVSSKRGTGTNFRISLPTAP